MATMTFRDAQIRQFDRLITLAAAAKRNPAAMMKAVDHYKKAITLGVAIGDERRIKTTGTATAMLYSDEATRQYSEACRSGQVDSVSAWKVVGLYLEAARIGRSCGLQDGTVKDVAEKACGVIDEIIKKQVITGKDGGRILAPYGMEALTRQIEVVKEFSLDSKQVMASPGSWSRESTSINELALRLYSSYKSFALTREAPRILRRGNTRKQKYLDKAEAVRRKFGLDLVSLERQS
jgi:hypothetical protein